MDILDVIVVKPVLKLVVRQSTIKIDLTVIVVMDLLHVHIILDQQRSECLKKLAAQSLNY